MPDDTSTRTPAAVQVLLDHYRNDWQLVTTLIERFASWHTLVHTARAELAQITGAAHAAGQLPADCPPLTHLRPQVRGITRWEHGWPVRLTDLHIPPPLIYTAGQLPAPPYVTVGGAANPTDAGLEVAASAGRVAARCGVPVAVLAGDRLGTAAARAHLDAGGAPLLIAPAAIDTLYTTDRRLLDDTLAAGGAGLAVYGSRAWPSDPTRRTAAHVAAALGSAVVIAEAGYHADGGRDLIEAAIDTGRYLIVRRPDHDHTTPLQAIGGASLATSRQFTARLFGTSPRIERRIAAGHSPADAVVVGPGDLEIAIAYACGQSSAAPVQTTADGWVTG